MASSAKICSLQQQGLFVLVLQQLVFVAAVTNAITGSYTSIFSFGDSLTDTGHLYFISPQSPNCLLPPYGETHFQHPTGRCSDGRLILDFIAESLGLPYLKPYLGFKNGAGKHGNIEQGVNFAVAGATALDRSFFEQKGFTVEVPTNYSLRGRLVPGCKKVLRSSLFIVGEIGANDYDYSWSETIAFEDVRAYIPQVISVVTSAIRELIDLGAETLMVPGISPLGCNPAFLTRFATIDEEYDQYGCLKWLNMFTEYHNDLLQIELNRLRVLYPRTNIVYADYFNAFLQFIKSPEQFGFNGNVLQVCCGGGGPYNFNDTAPCGNSGVIACDDPSQYVSWDGYHFTEPAYRWMTKGLLDGPYTIPKFSVSSCVASETS